MLLKHISIQCTFIIWIFCKWYFYSVPCTSFLLSFCTFSFTVTLVLDIFTAILCPVALKLVCPLNYSLLHTLQHMLSFLLVPLYIYSIFFLNIFSSYFIYTEFHHSVLIYPFSLNLHKFLYSSCWPSISDPYICNLCMEWCVRIHAWRTCMRSC